MLKILACTLILSFHFLLLESQSQINFEQVDTGTIRLAEGITIDRINSGYTLWMPSSGALKGLIVFFHGRRDNEPDSIILEATKRQLAVVYLTTSNLFEFLFEQDRLIELEYFLKDIIEKIDISSDKMLFSGMSLGGTRALKFSNHLRTASLQYHFEPRAIVICDAPLDVLRFRREALKASKLNAHSAAANEGYWVSQYLEINLGDEEQNYID